METFTIQFADVKPTSIDVELIWENTKVAFEIATEIDKSIMESIDKAMAVDARPYFQAATYYYENGKDLNKAYDWVKTATNQNPKAFWVWALKSKIENKMNNRISFIIILIIQRRWRQLWRRHAGQPGRHFGRHERPDHRRQNQQTKLFN